MRPRQKAKDDSLERGTAVHFGNHNKNPMTTITPRE